MSEKLRALPAAEVHDLPPADALRAVGLRVTAPRTATLEALATQPHSDADDLAATVRNRLGSVSRQAVYDVLHALEDAHLVRSIRLEGRSARYELNRHDNHHHLVCKRCDAIVDIPCAVGHAPCLVPPDHLGYDIEIAEVLFRGLCPSCQGVSGPPTCPLSDHSVGSPSTTQSSRTSAPPA
ncbi:Fur family transcriptional regulator [Devriesea agamarum]|uniref:Fur family transcriptional regulator n=1 Tax=Devriesea agamarum TaxID=472569 RepID=UPI0009FCD331|nr:Fur family transcriptional regulator [Devriesea agamarum]